MFLKSPNAKATAVWLLLVAATLLAWQLGTHPSDPSHYTLKAAAILMLIAIVKVRFVIMQFMEVGHAPLPLRLACEAWMIAVCVVIIGFYAYASP